MSLKPPTGSSAQERMMPEFDSLKPPTPFVEGVEDSLKPPTTLTETSDSLKPPTGA